MKEFCPPISLRLRMPDLLPIMPIFLWNTSNKYGNPIMKISNKYDNPFSMPSDCGEIR